MYFCSCQHNIIIYFHDVQFRHLFSDNDSSLRQIQALYLIFERLKFVETEKENYSFSYDQNAYQLNQLCVFVYRCLHYKFDIRVTTHFGIVNRNQ